MTDSTASPTQSPTDACVPENSVFSSDAASDLDDEDLEIDEFMGDTPTVILPSAITHLEAVGLTDVGPDRLHNEDFFVIDSRLWKHNTPDSLGVHARGLYVLCDGMGGHAQGEVASRLSAETISLYFAERWQSEMPDETDLLNAIYRANQTLFTLNESQTRLGSGRMGTTVVMALLQDTQLKFAHVGDSRLYRFTRRHGLEQLTVDHEVGQRAISHGISPDQAYAQASAYQLTQALGPRSEEALRPDVQSLTLTEDALFLLCSDGLTDNQLLEQCDPERFKAILAGRIDLKEGLQDLLELAIDHNGHDNITIIGIRVKLAMQGG